MNLHNCSAELLKIPLIVTPLIIGYNIHSSPHNKYIKLIISTINMHFKFTTDLYIHNIGFNQNIRV